MLRVLHPILSIFLTNVLDGVVGPGDPERCNGLFPGASYETLIGAATKSEFGTLRGDTWPSFYTMFLGFLTGYIGLLPVVYQAELAASPKRQSAVISGLVVLSVLVIVCIAYRFLSSCDTAFGISIGLLSGFILGAGIMAFLAWISDRRITNILNFPLIRSRATDGKPIYVCEK